MNPINRKTGEAVKVRKVRSDKPNSKGRNKSHVHSRKRQTARVIPLWEAFDAS